MKFQRTPGLVIGYHGCDAEIAEKIFLGTERVRDSNNLYDWLGHGQYFWESSQQRAMEWAETLAYQKTNSAVKTPAVVGAVIDLGVCLNLVDTACVDLIKLAYDDLRQGSETSILPENRDISGNSDLLLRKLDCAVIEHLHIIVHDILGIQFDTVRGVFTEGEPLYPNAGFRRKTHVQICVVNPDAVVGYFRPRELSDE